MSSVQHLREFISERLNAAAEEIFAELEKTIVQYEEEIDRQRRLLDIIWKPRRNSHITEAPHQYVFKEDEAVQDDQQLCDQKLSSNLDQEQPESARVKEEQEELLINQGGELFLKDETDDFSVIAVHGENYYDDQNPSNRDYIPSYTSPVDERSHLEGSTVEDSIKPTRYADRKSENNCQMKTNHVEESSLSESHCNTDHPAEKQCLCDTCGKRFLYPSSLKRHKTVHEKQYSCKTCGKTFRHKTKFTVHVRTHTGEKPYSCQTCGKCFSYNSDLLSHRRIHTGEKPFSCKTCGKCFSQSSILLRHMTTHTSEKPYSCKTCGKCFKRKYNLLCHMRSHTGEKPYSCKICGNCFGKHFDFLRHVKIHTGEKPYSCETCGKCFHQRNNFLCHKRIHTGEKPYSCKTCGKCFQKNFNLMRHMRTHTDEQL
ncbi:oocyte zinc finger protein XlCOF6.1-like [Melanotaenia boesemani]|uniref:oocyte zinc finger protein XlCOF6.1-like n=1 Tax=Melanotaenia boesemani TaxID=1250792 RepID=UPI001C052D86|nr:oocyte zinc finger protein XlCOF6.1-like [Melanotaenia boesemani]